MFISFTVENFLSFDSAQTITLEASKDKESPQNVVRNARGTNFDLLTSAAVYGANASGKSNLFEAMDYMRHFVLSSLKNPPPKGATGSNPFKLREKCQAEPSTFQMDFIIDSVYYMYGFSLDRLRILEEWLYSYPKKKKRTLFERNHTDGLSDDPLEDYRWGASWTGEARKLAKLTRPDALFLSVAANLNHPIAQKISSWFEELFVSVQTSPVGKSEETFTLAMCDNDPTSKRNILHMLKNADLAITDFKIQAIELRESSIYKQIPKEVFDDLFSKTGDSAANFEILQAFFYRHGIDKEGNSTLVRFEDFEESEGTRKYFTLAGPLLHVLTKGCCLYADELDLHLHPDLTRAIVELFHDPHVNKNGAQLIFSTHNANLLEVPDLLRRDQVWLTEKKDTGDSTLNSLWDYKVRKDENLAKGYIAGRYGGVPYIEQLINSIPENK